jgi:hypothetical protein
MKKFKLNLMIILINPDHYETHYKTNQNKIT